MMCIQVFVLFIFLKFKRKKTHFYIKMFIIMFQLIGYFFTHLRFSTTDIYLLFHIPFYIKALNTCVDTLQGITIIVGVFNLLNASENSYSIVQKNIEAKWFKSDAIFSILVFANFCSLFICITLVGSATLWQFSRLFFLKTFSSYIFFSIIFFILFLTNLLIYHFKYINELLLELKRVYLDEFNFRRPQNPVFYLTIKELNYLKKFKKFMGKYNDEVNLMENFNKCFKNFYVFMIINIMLAILHFCILITDNFLKKSNYYGFNRFTLLMILTFFTTLLYLVLMGHAVLTALIGERLQEEGFRTSALCYAFLSKLSIHPNELFEKRIKEQIYFLLDQSKSRKICLHAGGFFTLNWSIIGIIAHTVATYSIIIIQFIVK